VNRVAIVTGSARGIGAAAAGRLAEDGIDVAVLDIDPVAASAAAAGIERAGGRAIAVDADVSDADSVQKAVDEVAHRLGPPGILVNNAGITRDNLLFYLSPTDWDLVINVNLRGTFLMTHAVAEHMAKLGWGRVVNLSSIAAVGNVGQAKPPLSRSRSTAHRITSITARVEGIAMPFTAGEVAYLRSQSLGRLATIGAGLGTIDITGRELSGSRKYRDIQSNGRVAFIVDDIPPCSPSAFRGWRSGSRPRRCRPPTAPAVPS
jgi:3-oxoacyl-[acyl-carrier protein] reductase